MVLYTRSFSMGVNSAKRGTIGTDRGQSGLFQKEITTYIVTSTKPKKRDVTCDDYRLCFYYSMCVCVTFAQLGVHDVRFVRRMR